MRRDYLSAKRFFWLECSIFFTALCALWKPLSGVADGNDPPVLTADSFLAPLGDVKCGVFTNAPLPTGAASFSNGIPYLPPSGDLPMGIYTNAYPFDVPSYTLSDGWDRDCEWWYYLGIASVGDIDQNDFAAATRGQAKWFARQAALASSLEYTGYSAYTDLIAALADSLTPSNDLAPVTVGEIKDLSILFWLRQYEQLQQGNLMSGRDSPPWTGMNTNDTAFANIGQLKNAFSVSFNQYFEDYVDSDQDGFPDGLESSVGMDPYVWDPFDPDGDGTGTAYELMAGMNPFNPDTDGDGMPDGWEIQYGTNPLVQDQWDDPDGDGIANIWEYTHGLNPSSDDGYMDDDEDHDGLYFADEFALDTDPFNPDTDGDGLPDGWEYWRELDPLSPNGGDGAYGDPDGDCVANIWEYLHGYRPDLYDCSPWADYDDDGLDTYEEFALDTDPFNPDTDGDGLPDGWEYWYGLDPCSDTGDDGTDGDPDEDGWTNLEEYRYGMDPMNAETDSDNDGVPDALEMHLFGNLTSMNSPDTLDVDGVSLLFKLWNGLETGVGGMGIYPSSPDTVLEFFPGLYGDRPFRTQAGSVLCERTVTVDTLNGWRQFFLSDMDYDQYPFLQAMHGVIVEWTDSNGTNGVISAAELTRWNALRIPLIPSASPTRLTIRIRAAGTNVSISGSPCLMQCTSRLSYSVVGGYESMMSGMDGEQVILINCLDEEYYVTATPYWESPLMDGVTLSGIPVAGPPATLNALFSCEVSGNGNAAQDVTFVPSPGVYVLPVSPAPSEEAEDSDPVTLVAIAPGFRSGIERDYTEVSYDESSGDYPDGDGYPLDTPCLRKAMNSTHSLTNSVTYKRYRYSSQEFDIGCPGAGAYVTWEEQQDGLVIVYFDGVEVWRGYPDGEEDGYEEYTVATGYGIDDDECCPDGCGGGDCDALDGPSLGSVRFRLLLGKPDAGTISGFLWFDSRNGLAVTPSCLSLLKNGDSAVSDMTSGGTRRVTCHDDHGRDIFISPVTGGIEISVYLEDSSLDCVWRITNVNGSETSINFQKISRLGNVMRDETFRRVESGARYSKWEREDNISGMTELLHRTDTLSVNNTRVLARETRDASGSLLSCVTNRYMVFAGKTCSVLRETERSERTWYGGADVSTVSYWADFNNPKRNGKPRLSMATGKPWSYRRYDDSGRETMRLEEWGNFLIPQILRDGGDCDRFSLPEDATCTMTVSEYIPHYGDPFDEGNIEKPRTESVYLVRNGVATLTGRTWYIYTQSETNGSTVTTVRTIRAASQAAQIGDPANAVSIRTAYEDYGGIPSVLRGRTLFERDEDGLERFYAIEAGTFDPPARTFTPGAGNTALRTVTRTFREGLEADTRRVEVQDFDSGNALYEAELLTADGSAVSWESHAYDVKGRLRSSLYPDGTSETNAWSCCRLLWSGSRDGAVTLRSAQTGRDRLYHAFEEVSATNLPGLPGRAGHPVTLHFFDALGRETNVTETAALVPGSASTPDFQAIGGKAVTVTEYPDGTADRRITTDPRGLRTLTQSSRGYGSETEETVTFPPEGEGGPDISLIRTGEWLYTPTKYFTRVTRWTRPGGWETEVGEQTVERFPDYSPDGCRADYEMVVRSNQWVTNRITRYDFLGRAVSVTTPSGTSSNIYDGASSRILRSVAPDGAVTEYGYDAEGNRTSTRSLASGVASLSTNRYETLDGVLWRVEERTSTASNGVTRLDGVTRTRLTGLSPALRSETRTLDADGIETVSVQSFDEATATLCTSVSNSLCATPRVTLSVAGNAVSSSSASGVTEYLYDGRGRRCAEIITSLPSGVTNAWVSLAFSDAGDVTNAVTAWADGTAATNGFVRDCRGNPSEERDAEGGVTERERDGWNRLSHTGGDGAYLVRYGYDPSGNRDLLATSRDNGATWDTNRWSFDFEGRATNRVFADGSSVSWEYDAGGRLSSKRDARGWRTSYNRDAAGRVVSRQTPGWYTRYSLTRDAWGDIAGETVDEGPNWPMLDTAYARDLCGNATNETVEIYGAEYGLSRTFDGFSRLTSLTAVGETAFYGYDTENRLSAVSNAVFTVTYAFTSDGLDAGYTVTFTNGTVVTRAVTRHPYRRGLVTGVTNTVNGIIVSAYAYAHDRLGRVVSRNGDAFGYNPRSEVVSAAISTNAYSYSYDSVGNSLHSARNAETNLYAANALNQYASVTGAGGAQSLSYDADGNLLTWNGYSLVWDPDNRLYYGGGGTSDFGFFRDWSGRAFSETENAYYTDRVFDGWNPVFERVFDASTELPLSDTVYVWGADLSGTLRGAGGVGGLLAVKRDGAWYAPLYDANGNVTAYVSETGDTVATYEYDAFGNTIRQSGSLSDAFRHRFSTKPWIAALGAYDFGERMYSPELRRWLSRDPIGEDGGVNLFAFVKNSPLRYIDPIGLMDREEFGCCSDDRVIIELSKKLEEARNMSVTHPVGYRVLGRDPSGAWKLETMREFLEYGGFICCKDGKVSSTGPYPGTFRFDQQNGIPVEPVHSELPKWLANSTMGRWGVLGFTPTSSNVLHNKQAHCKGGAKNVVFYHYHPNSSSFSRGDIGVSKQIPIALYSEGKSYIEILIGGTGGQIIELGKGWAGDNERDL